MNKLYVSLNSWIRFYRFGNIIFDKKSQYRRRIVNFVHYARSAFKATHIYE